MVETMYADDDALIVDYRQDAEFEFEHVAKVRREKDVWGHGMKRDFVHAAYIPVGVVMELFGIGVNIYTAETKDIVAGLKKLHRWDACRLTDKRIA